MITLSAVAFILCLAIQSHECNTDTVPAVGFSALGSALASASELQEVWNSEWSSHAMHGTCQARQAFEDWGHMGSRSAASEVCLFDSWGWWHTLPSPFLLHLLHSSACGHAVIRYGRSHYRHSYPQRSEAYWLQVPGSVASIPSRWEELPGFDLDRRCRVHCQEVKALRGSLIGLSLQFFPSQGVVSSSFGASESHSESSQATMANMVVP